MAPRKKHRTPAVGDLRSATAAPSCEWNAPPGGVPSVHQKWTLIALILVEASWVAGLVAMALAK